VQTFPHVLDSIGDEHRGGKFAIIIDEAHSSQSGKTSSAVSQAVADSEDEINDALRPELGQEGKVADYIPALARVPADRFGIALRTCDGSSDTINMPHRGIPTSSSSSSASSSSSSSTLSSSSSTSTSTSPMSPPSGDHSSSEQTSKQLLDSFEPWLVDLFVLTCASQMPPLAPQQQQHQRHQQQYLLQLQAQPYHYQQHTQYQQQQHKQ
jgi:hypothetical protein